MPEWNYLCTYTNDGGTLITPNLTVAGVWGYAPTTLAGSQANFTLNSGEVTITGNDANSLAICATNSPADRPGTFDMNGGTLTATNATLVVYRYGRFELSGGTLTVDSLDTSDGGVVAFEGLGTWTLILDGSPSALPSGNYEYDPTDMFLNFDTGSMPGFTVITSSLPPPAGTVVSIR